MDAGGFIDIRLRLYPDNPQICIAYSVFQASEPNMSRPGRIPGGAARGGATA